MRIRLLALAVAAAGAAIMPSASADTCLPTAAVTGHNECIHDCLVSVGVCDGGCIVNYGTCSSGGQCAVNVGTCNDGAIISVLPIRP